MFLGESFGDPDNRDGIQACGIRKQLPEMRMISALKLVFNQHPIICSGVLAKNICPKGSDFCFLRFQLQFDADRFSK